VAVLVLASSPGGCQPATGSQLNDPALPDACQVDPGGIHVENGAVVVNIKVACDPQPGRHEIKGWLGHRQDARQGYAQLSATPWVTTVPAAEGFTVHVESRPCKDGQWKAFWRAKGKGPPPLSAKFDYQDSDAWPTPITKEQCWGWE